MDYNFTSSEMIFIYGKMEQKLEALRATGVIDPKADLKLCRSIIKKLEQQHPQLTNIPL